jgi:hypothetical protein
LNDLCYGSYLVEGSIDVGGNDERKKKCGDKCGVALREGCGSTSEEEEEG